MKVAGEQKIGCPTHTTSPPRQPHVIIALNSIYAPDFRRKAREMYESGLSLRGIGHQLGIPKSTVRDILIQDGVVLRSHKRVPYRFNGIVGKTSIRNAPYGYKLLNGRLEEHPVEQSVLTIIYGLNAQEVSACGIAKRLNEQNIRPRKASRWTQPIISLIIKRKRL